MYQQGCHGLLAFAICSWFLRQHKCQALNGEFPESNSLPISCAVGASRSSKKTKRWMTSLKTMSEKKIHVWTEVSNTSRLNVYLRLALYNL